MSQPLNHPVSGGSGAASHYLSNPIVQHHPEHEMEHSIPQQQMSQSSGAPPKISQTQPQPWLPLHPQPVFQQQHQEQHQHTNSIPYASLHADPVQFITTPSTGDGREQQQESVNSHVPHSLPFATNSIPMGKLLSTASVAPDKEAQKLGFKPTPAMVKLHEQMVVQFERPLFQFQVTKLRSWRTGYIRLLSLYHDRFLTFDPDSHQITNTWSYTVLTDWMALPKEKNVLLLQASSDKLKFQCHHVDRAVVLSALLECKLAFESNNTANSSAAVDWPIMSSCTRATRHGSRVPMSLRVAPHGLQELHPTTRWVIQTYRYTEILAVSFTADEPTGIVFHLKNGTAPVKYRLFFIQSSRPHGNGRSDLLTLMREHFDTLGMELPIGESSLVAAWQDSRGAIGSRQRIVMTWDVTKVTARHDAAIVGPSQGCLGGTVSRTLAVTSEGYLMELDGGFVVSIKSLADVHALVRHYQSDKVTIEYKGGCLRVYESLRRDALLVSLLDAAHNLSNNKTIDVSDVTSSGYSLSDSAKAPEEPGGLFQPISVPLYCLKRVHALSTAAFAFLNHRDESSTKAGQKVDVVEESRATVNACREFTASITPNGEGLPRNSSDKYILGSTGALWGIVSRLLADQAHNSRDRHQAELAATPLLQVLYRLLQTPAGFKGTAELSTFQGCIRVFWDVEDAFCQFWSLRVLLTLMVSPFQPSDKEVEYVNKRIILQTGGRDLVEGLVTTILYAGEKNSVGKQVVSDLTLMVTSDILQSILCSNYDTTNPEYFGAFLDALAKGYRALLASLRSETPYVIENTALLLHLLSSHAPATAAAIRDAALSSGILIQHFYAAIFSPLEGQRFLSRYLCSLWLSGPMTCGEKRLLKRMVPSGFLGYLKMPILSNAEEVQLDELERDGIEVPPTTPTSNSTVQSLENKIEIAEGAAGTNTTRLRSRIAIAADRAESMPHQHIFAENFRIFFHMLTKDQALPDLIWNQQTRRELRIALENEMQSVKREIEVLGGLDHIAWNHQQFTVAYPSLDDEVKVGTVYLRLWLQAGDGFIKSWEEPVRLFEILFRRFLCELDRNIPVTIMCIRCLERLYRFHADEIGPFQDIMILVNVMACTKSVETQHRLLALVATLLGVSSDDDMFGRINIPDNAEQLLNLESMGQLCQFVAWCHTNGAQVGNLLSTSLKIQEKGTMITNGNAPILGGTGVEKSFSSLDGPCPAIWFVASTGKSPPPADKIRGPFRVSELRKMMEDGDLQPFDQVTASNVDDYDADVIDGRLREAQIDKGKWRRLEQVWQLRWQLCTDGNTTGIFSPAEISRIALKALTRLVDLHMSLDSRGVPYFPVPIAKRLLCGLNREPSTARGASSSGVQANYLSMLSQSLLCNDHKVIEASAELLQKLLEHNEGPSAKFYLTGAFFFVCCYTGSNFRTLSKLLHDLHLKQHFRSGFAAAANDKELPVKERSILGNILPEGLLFIMVNYGSEKFAEVFLGNFDTPEVIWNLEMRKHMVEMVRQHLGDFPQRLWQNTTTEYEYCPIPGLAFKRLEGEIFCHNYYLENLCDETRFPDWPIAEPVELFRGCLEEWKLQMNRDEVMEEDAREEARIALDLKTGDGSKELRHAYRKLARKFHPDKNPAGRDMFETIQTAYQLLLPILESGETIAPPRHRSNDENEDGNPISETEGLPGGRRQMKAVHLLLRAQLLVCKRYPVDVGKYKYPAYRMLLQCIALPASCADCSLFLDANRVLESPLLHRGRADFVKTVADLVFETCAVSPLNAEELVAEGGVACLAQVLDFYIKAMPFVQKTEEDMKNTSIIQNIPGTTVLEIMTLLVHTLAGVSFFESGRNAIFELKDVRLFCFNWRCCVEGKFGGVQCSADSTVGLKKYALEGLAYLSKKRELQHMMAGSGVLWPLLRYMLGFDPTLEKVQTGPDDVDDVQMSQAASNTQARLSARSLGMLCGVLKDPALEAPLNQSLFSAVSKLLTPPLSRLLRNKRTGSLLRALNSNVESPVRIWNVRMRDELTAFVVKQENDLQQGQSQSFDEQLDRITSSFDYAALKNEITIGGVYVRIFVGVGSTRASVNEIPSFSLFAKSLLNFVVKCLNESQQGKDKWVPLVEYKIDNSESTLMTCEVDDPKFEMALLAVKSLLSVDGMIDDIIFEDQGQAASILLSLLELSQDGKAFAIGSEILAMLSPKEAFADAVAKQGTLWRLLCVLERPCENADDDSACDASMSHVVAVREQKGWALLETLSSSSSIALELIHSSGWIELLGIVVGYSRFTKSWTSRQGAAKSLSRLLWDPTTGTLTSALLGRFLPKALTVLLKEQGPDAMLRVFDGESETPELIWDSEMRGELRVALAEKLDERFSGSWKYSLPAAFSVQYRKIQDELYLGGVYVRLYLKEPTYSLRDPSSFLKRSLQRWSQEIALMTSKAAVIDDYTPTRESTELSTPVQDKLELVTSAIVYLCKVRETLCDKLAEWGYMATTFLLMKEVLATEMIGTPLLSIIRLLHVASNRMSNVEMMAVVGNGAGGEGVVDYTIRAIGTANLHPDSAFMLEMLKKVFKLALGEVEKSKTIDSANVDSHVVDRYRGIYQHNSSAGEGLWPLATAPSPAPGPGPVQKTIALDDPLAVFRTDVTPVDNPAQIMSSTSNPLTLVPRGTSHPLGNEQAQNHHLFHQRTHNQLQQSQEHAQLQTNSAGPRGGGFSQQAQRFQHHAFHQIQQEVFLNEVSNADSGMGQPLALPIQNQAMNQDLQGQNLYAQQPQNNPFPRSRAIFSQEYIPQAIQPLSHHASLPQTVPTGSFTHRSQIMQTQHFQRMPTETPASRLHSFQAQQPRNETLQQAPHPQTQWFPTMHAPMPPVPQSQTQYTQANTTTHHTASNSQAAYAKTQSLGMTPQRVSAQDHVTIRGLGQFPNGSSLPASARSLEQAQQVSVERGSQSQLGNNSISNQMSSTQSSKDRPTFPHNDFPQPGAFQDQTIPGHEAVSFPLNSVRQQYQDPLAPHLEKPAIACYGNIEPQQQSSIARSQIRDDANLLDAAGTPSKPIEGTGIDARTGIDPTVTAEKQTLSVDGAPGSAQGRVSLLQSAIACKLVDFLLNRVLENVTLSKVKDPAAAKVHAVDLIKLLTRDPGYGLKFKLELEKEPAWQKYKSQDHSLFISGTDQKTDYFLTSGNVRSPMLITEK